MERIELVMEYDFSGFPAIGTSVSMNESSGKSKIMLSSLDPVKLSDDSIKKYIPMQPRLKHVRTGDSCEAYLYTKNDIPVCVLSVETKSNGEKWIQALEVFKGYKRQGLGKQMLEYACNHLGAQFLSVNKDNEPALQLYRLHGFKIYSSTGNMYFMKLNENKSTN